MQRWELATYDLVLGLVALRLEVKVVVEGVLAALVRRREDDAHVELSPSLLVNAEWRLLERCTPVSMHSCLCKCGAPTLLVLVKGRVQVVDGLLVDGGQDLGALVVQQPDLDVP